MKLYNEDCLPAMLKMEDNQFDLAIVDPPYGIGVDGNKEQIHLMELILLKILLKKNIRENQ